jgi:hypothetical protein
MKTWMYRMIEDRIIPFSYVTVTTDTVSVRVLFEIQYKNVKDMTQNSGVLTRSDGNLREGSSG